MTTKTTEGGLLLVDKPATWTSHDVVAKVRSIAGTRRVGHAGTLDPMATGLLILGVGQATKLLTFLVGEDKTYEATIRLGQATVTDDREGDVVATKDASGVTVEQLETAIEPLIGQIMQVPSSVSAIKVNGERAYTRVRRGEDFKLAARPVTVSRFELKSLRRLGSFIDLDVVVDCSSGTYIRALARDLGASLGVYGHLQELRRTRIGSYQIEDAQNLSGDLEFTSMEVAARHQFRSIELRASEVTDLLHGKRIKAEEMLQEPVAAYAPDGRLLAMLTRSGSQYKSLVVFPEASE